MDPGVLCYSPTKVWQKMDFVHFFAKGRFAVSTDIVGVQSASPSGIAIVCCSVGNADFATDPTPSLLILIP